MIYQIYFDQASKDRLMEGAKGVHNKTLHPSFENQVIASLAPTIQDDRFGFLSHKFKLKNPNKRYNVPEIMEAAEKVDVLSFFGKHKTKNMVQYMSQNMLFDFKSLLEILLDGTGYQVPDKTSFVVYQNAFIAKKEIYHEYVTDVLKPAFMNSNKCIDLLWSRSNYSGNKEALSRLNTQYQKKMSVYPIWPFAFELLFSIYLEHKNFECKHY